MARLQNLVTVSRLEYKSNFIQAVLLDGSKENFLPVSKVESSTSSTSSTSSINRLKFKLQAYFVGAYSRRDTPYLKKYREIIKEDLRKAGIKFEFNGDESGIQVDLSKKEYSEKDIANKLKKYGWQPSESASGKGKTILKHKEYKYLIQVFKYNLKVPTAKTRDEIEREVEQEIQRVIRHNPEKVPDQVKELDLRDQIRKAIETDNMEKPETGGGPFRRYHEKKIPTLVIIELSHRNKNNK